MNRRSSFSKRRKQNMRETDDGLSRVVLSRGNIDWTILLMTIILVSFGIVMIFSASYYESDLKYDNPMFFAARQLQWVAIGTFFAIVLTFIDIQKIRKFVGMAYVVCVALLVLVLIMGIASKGSQRWIGFGGIQFQPSDFAKLATILFLANYISVSPQKIRTFFGFMGALVIVGIPAALIMIENASTGIIVGVVGLIVIFIAGAKYKHFAMLIPVMILLGALFIIAEPYRIKRILAWMDPNADKQGDSFQTLQSLYAIASGGIFGVGFDNSRQKLGFIPESHNDIIFAIICEELGFVGAFLVVLVFGILIWRGFIVALHAPDNFMTYAAAGIVSMIAVQVVMNIAVATGTMPNTGVALPFISYGGSSVIVMLASIGILLNISRHFNESDT